MPLISQPIAKGLQTDERLSQCRRTRLPPPLDVCAPENASIDFGREYRVRKNRFERAGLVQLPKLFGVKAQVERGYVVVQLLQVAGPHDRGGYAGLRRKPRQGDLRRRAVELRGYPAQRVEHAPVAVCELRFPEWVGAAEPALAAGPSAFAPVLAGQKTGGERAPWRDAEAARTGGGQVLAFYTTLHEGVFD